MGRPRVRDKIVIAARELLEQSGAAALTTRAVAEQAGVTEASLFNNFGDKAGLIRALIQEQLPVFEQFSDCLQADPDGDLQAWLVAILAAARNYFSVVLPLAAPQLLQGQRSTQSKPADSYSGHRPLVDRLEALQRTGQINVDADTAALALLVMGPAMHSALTDATQGGDALGNDIEQWSRRLAATLLPLMSVV